VSTRYQVLLAQSLLDAQEAVLPGEAKTCTECHCLECRASLRKRQPCCDLEKALRFAERIIERDSRKPGLLR
jgi:hypothetical protein